MIIAATEENIRLAAILLRNGKLVAFPTETVYGLGANALDRAAVAQIFKLKGRPAINPLIVHIHSTSQLPQVASIEAGSICEKRLERLSQLWPGPLSLVLPKHPTVPGCVTANLNTVALRIPAHPTALALLQEVALPIAAPSANLSSKVSPTCPEHVEREIGKDLEIILDGGACSVGLESTVLSIYASKAVILRPGAITREQLEDLLGEQVFLGQSVSKQAASQATLAPASPGMLFKHYTPNTKMLFKEALGEKRPPANSGLISLQSAPRVEQCSEYKKVICLGGKNSLEEVASGLYAAIHELDLLGLDLIVIETCEERGIGVAIMDRLKRACGCI